MSGAARFLAAAGLVGGLALATPAGASAGPLGLPCHDVHGVRWCASNGDPAGGPDTRVRSFDGVPLDVSVTLPPRGASRLPLVMHFHGFAGAHPGPEVTARWARRGYAVLAYSFRGMGDSCGYPESRSLDPAGCARGWIRVGDVRYDARDAQHLAGLLVDEGVADPQRIAAEGYSYGGAQAWLLAVLRDRVALPDGSLVPWRSPAGVPLRIAAAAPSTTWSDFAQALQPNGNDHDWAVVPAGAGHEPRGVLKQSLVSSYFALGLYRAYYPPPGAEPGPDFSAWFTRASLGEPFDDDSAAGLGGDVSRYRSPYNLDPAGAPAPLLLSAGWADDLMPASEVVRFHNRTRAQHPEVPVALHLADIGHLRARSLPAQEAAWRDAVDAWIDHFLLGRGARPPGVTAYERNCDAGEERGAIWRGSAWRSLQPGEIRFVSGERHVFDARGGDPRVARDADPVGGVGPCGVVAFSAEPGVPQWRLPATGGFTLLGAPTVISTLSFSERALVAARLWDEAPDESKRLVTRGVYRPARPGRAVFQLNPVAWRFRAGHRPLLQLLGRDAPFVRPANSWFEVTVDGLELRLPVHARPGPVLAGGEPPADGRTVGPPAPPVLPRGLPAAPGVGGLRVAAAGCRPMRLALAAEESLGVTRVAFRAQGRRVVDRRPPFRAALRRGPWSALAVLADGRSYEYRGAAPCRR